MISEFWRFGFLSCFVAYLPRTNLWFILMPYLKPRWRRWLKWIRAIPPNTKKSTTKAVDGSQDSLLVKLSPKVRYLPRKRRLCLLFKNRKWCIQTFNSCIILFRKICRTGETFSKPHGFRISYIYCYNVFGWWIFRWIIEWSLKYSHLLYPHSGGKGGGVLFYPRASVSPSVCLHVCLYVLLHVWRLFNDSRKSKHK